MKTIKQEIELIRKHTELIKTLTEYILENLDKKESEG